MLGGFRSLHWIVDEIILMQSSLNDDINLDIKTLTKLARKRIISFVLNDPRSVFEIGSSKEIDSQRIKYFLLHNRCRQGFETQDVPLFRAYPEEYLVFLKHWFVYITDWQSAIYEVFDLPLEAKFERYLQGFENTKYPEKIGLTFDIFKDYIDAWGLNNSQDVFWLTEDRKKLRRKYYD